VLRAVFDRVSCPHRAPASSRIRTSGVLVLDLICILGIVALFAIVALVAKGVEKL